MKEDRILMKSLLEMIQPLQLNEQNVIFSFVSPTVPAKQRDTLKNGRFLTA